MSNKKEKTNSEKIIIDPFKTGGHFGQFGGRYVPEMMVPPLEELEAAYIKAKKDKEFIKEYEYTLKTFSGRPTPLLFAKNLTEKLKGAKIYLKLEGQGQTGSHKINNAIGQALLAKRMGKKRLIAETGAGQHGFATATVAAKFGFECEIFMGLTDMKRQRPNVFWMEQLGAKVTPVTTGSMTLKDAVNESIRNWIETVDSTHLLVGSALAAHPYPVMVRDFQSVIGKEVKKQLKESEGKLPDYLVACVGGGSNAIGLFHPFLEDERVKMIGVEAGGLGLKSGKHAVRFKGGKEGVIEGYRSIFLQNEDGQTRPTHSVAAGLDYPGIGPEHAYLKSIGRVDYHNATDKEVVEALKLLISSEGIIPALESSHAVARGLKIAKKAGKDEIVVINISGRGDKDIFIIAEALGDKEWISFLKTKVEEAEGK
ncbi:MAG: tryptophan synthase subunit beta [bacterium]|nr:tryptophan synthase subunit beta [bacterium]